MRTNQESNYDVYLVNNYIECHSFTHYHRIKTIITRNVMTLTRYYSPAHPILNNSEVSRQRTNTAVLLICFLNSRNVPRCNLTRW